MANISEYLTKAAEFDSRAAIATNWQLKATFKDLARFYRQMAMYLEQTGQSDPKKRLSEPDHWDRRLLPARGNRPHSQGRAKKCDELPSLHSITSSERARREGGTVRPSAFAVLRT